MTVLSQTSASSSLSLIVPPPSAPTITEHGYIPDLPTNKQGKLTRRSLLKLVGERAQRWDKEKRPFFTIYSGSRPGKREEYTQTAKELGKAIEDKGWVVVNGGTTPGIMGAALENVSRVLCVIPSLFATNTGAGVACEDMHSSAFNLVVPDFWERKTGMTLLANGGFFVLPGGFGSLDEALETIVFAQKRNTHVTFVNPDGYWDRTLAQLSFFVAQGLMPKEYTNFYSSVTSGREAVELAASKISHLGPRTPNNGFSKPTESLRSHLEANLGLLPETIYSFVGNAPRVGVIASGNIGSNEDIPFNLTDKALRTELVRNTKKISRAFAQAGAALVLMGDRRGLRAHIADAVLKANGKVIWLQKGYTNDPLHTSRLGKREMVIETPRYFERSRLFATLSQGQFMITGGIHTANEALTHATRNQTGHGDYCDLVPQCRDRNRERMVIHAYDPYLDKNGTRLWLLIQDQFRHCSQEGFLNPNDLGLISFHQRSTPIVKHVLGGISTQPDFLREMQALARTPKGRPMSQLVPT